MILIKVLLSSMRCSLSFIIIILFLQVSTGYSEEYQKNMAVCTRAGASVPLGYLGDRMSTYLPYVSLSFRLTPPYDYARYLELEVEAGFYGYRAREEAAGRRMKLYAEPVMVTVMPKVHIWGGLFALPRFGVGFIFNQARDTASWDENNRAGAYNHVACAAGAEVLYRINDRVGISVRTVFYFGFDKNRVLYHAVPDAGVALYF